MNQAGEPHADPRPSGDDPLIDEIREIRRKLSERFDNDPVRLGEHARRVSDAYRNGGITAALEASASLSAAVAGEPE